MQKILKKIIERSRKVKYQNILFTKKEFVVRENTVNLVLKLEHKNTIKKKFCPSCKFFINNLNKYNFMNFYKKFNFNLLLKRKYDLKTYKKKSRKDACFRSYLIFNNFLIKEKKINNLQKLNTLLKINDLLLIKFSKKKHIHLVKEFKNYLLIEKNLIKKFL